MLEKSYILGKPLHPETHLIKKKKTLLISRYKHSKNYE